MGMTERWREEWKVFRQSLPGQRFRERYERMRALPRPVHERIARWVGGIAILVVGVVLIPLPGPGWLIVGFGVTMLAQESRPISGFCDRVEVRFRDAVARWRRWRAERAAARRT